MVNTDFPVMIIQIGNAEILPINKHARKMPIRIKNSIPGSNLRCC
jgi:hypothetical protein